MTEPHSSAPRPRPTTTRQLATLGGAVAAGWVLHDLAVILTTGGIPLVGLLLPGSLGAVLTGTAVGALTARARWAPIALAASAGAWSLAVGRAGAVSPLAQWTPRAVLLLAVALSLGVGLSRIRTLHPLRLGLCLGALACVLKTAWRVDMMSQSWPVLWFALAALAMGLLPRVTARVAGTVVAFLVLCWPLIIHLQAWPRVVLGNSLPGAQDAPPGAPHLVLIVLDTVRADHLAPYGYDRVTTPGLDEWALERATKYTRARSTSPWTLPSHASLLTGLFPSEHGATHPRLPSSRNRVALGLRPDVPTLADLLHAAGWSTGAVVANGAFLKPIYGIDRGFEYFEMCLAGRLRRNYLALPQMAGHRLEVGHRPFADGAMVTDRALEWIDERDQRPFFLLLNYMDAHSPYLPPPPFRELFGGERPRDLFEPDERLEPLLYDRGLRYLDHHLSRFLDGLDERGLDADTVVIVTSDHGEAFGEHGFRAHGLTMYEEVVRVPLWVKPAGGRRAAIVDDDVSGADVFHIALRELGVRVERANPAPGWIGASYAPRDETRWEHQLFPDHAVDVVAWMEGTRKVMVRASGEVMAHDLESDPLELHPIRLAPEEIEAARANARAWWTDHPPPEAEAVAVGDEELELLQALGYAGDKP